MTKQELAGRMARTVGANSTALAHIEAFMREVSNAVARGERVDLRGFGSFAPVVRKPKVGRTGRGLREATVIPGHTVVKFKPAPALNELVDSRADQRTVPPSSAPYAAF